MMISKVNNTQAMSTSAYASASTKATQSASKVSDSTIVSLSSNVKQADIVVQSIIGAVSLFSEDSSSASNSDLFSSNSSSILNIASDSSGKLNLAGNLTALKAYSSSF